MFLERQRILRFNRGDPSHSYCKGILLGFQVLFCLLDRTECGGFQPHKLSHSWRSRLQNWACFRVCLLFFWQSILDSCLLNCANCCSVHLRYKSEHSYGPYFMEGCFLSDFMDERSICKTADIIVCTQCALPFDAQIPKACQRPHVTVSILAFLNLKICFASSLTFISGGK